jgi:hypothetical protein
VLERSSRQVAAFLVAAPGKQLHGAVARCVGHVSESHRPDDCRGQCRIVNVWWRDGFLISLSFARRFRAPVSRGSADIMCATLKLMQNDSMTAGNVALGNRWLTALGILVDDRVSCILRSIGLAEGFQQFTLRRFGSKRAAQSTDLLCMCTCPVDRMSAAGSEDL